MRTNDPFVLRGMAGFLLTGAVYEPYSMRACSLAASSWGGGYMHCRQLQSYGIHFLIKAIIVWIFSVESCICFSSPELRYGRCSRRHTIILRKKRRSPLGHTLSGLLSPPNIGGIDAAVKIKRLQSLATAMRKTSLHLAKC